MMVMMKMMMTKITTIEEQVEKLEVSLEGACSVADEELGMFDDQDGNGDDNGDDKSD